MALKQAVDIFRKIEVDPWEKWFAWYPVKLQGKRIWFKKICRRRIWRYGGDNWEYYTWEYGTLFDVLTQRQ
jgi:hypothetical protein